MRNSIEHDEKKDKGFGKTGKRYLIYAFLMNLFCYPLIVLWTIVGIIIFPILFAFLKILTHWDKARVMRFIIWLYGRGWIVIVSPFVRFKREGFETQPIDLPSIIIINHLSFFDIYCMGLLPVSNISFAVRSWPFRMPWFTPFMRLAAYIDLERIGWERALEAGKNIFSKKGGLLFFPEGHRSPDGQIKRFFSGPFKLALETGVPLLPLCISGTDVLLPAGRWWMHPARVRLAMLPAVNPQDFDGLLGHIKMKKHIKAIMAEKIADMRGK